MLFESNRLVFRPYTMDDFDALYAILSDAETMQHYPKPYDADGTRRWIQWNLNNYRDYGFGLWAMEQKGTGTFIGDCGITMQRIDGDWLPEIGYHVHKAFWRQGLGSEAARAVRDWGFQHTDFDCLYSYMNAGNVASWSTAAANGMRRIKEFTDCHEGLMYAYAITREEWHTLTKTAKRF